MITSAEHLVEKSLTEVEGRIRQSLETFQNETANRLKRLRQYLADRPVRSVVVAFTVGLGLAHLLQRLR